MKKTFKYLLPLTLLLATGCAQMVTKRYSPSRGGVVKYNTGFFLADKNREKAVEEMNSFCSPGRPTILQEDSKIERTGVTNHSGENNGNRYSGRSTESKESNIYIKFACSGKSRTARR